jgi:hypothetical protein
MWRTPSTGLREPFGLPQQTRTFLYRRLRWFDSATSLSWNVRFLIDQGTPRDCADLIDSEAATAWSSGRETAHDQCGPWHLPSATPVRTIQSAPAGPFASDHQKRAGVNRDALCLGLGSIEHFMRGSECRTRANPRHLVMHHNHHGLNYATPGWLGAYAGAPPQDPYDSVPSYNDPSKFGGEEALPVR